MINRSRTVKRVTNVPATLDKDLEKAYRLALKLDGEKVSYDNAFRKLWPLFGFLLAEKNLINKRTAS